MLLKRLFLYKSNLFLYRRSVTAASVSSDDLQKKIIYNCFLHHHDESNLSYSKKKKLYIAKDKALFLQGKDDRPDEDAHCLKYLRNDKPVEETPEVVERQAAPPPAKFPFQRNKSVIITEKLDEVLKRQDLEEDLTWSESPEKILKKFVKEKNWTPHNPDILNDAVVLDEQIKSLKYGSADPTIPVSHVSCGGCGALLHCQDTSIPGFLPKEIFEGLNNAELKTLVCQRCHFLKEYDIALGVDVTPEDYPKILAPIKKAKALVLLMVDLLDMPCSIWPGLTELIGPRRPIVVVGNKIDLLVQDSSQLLRHVKESLMESLLEAGVPRANVKHIALISAKSGYGVEDLITEIHSFWRYQGDIYIVGCTNAGKSTLFNTLIQSDMCKVQAVDLMQRATVSEWPGTTLNLLKFPILRPSTWRLHVRKTRMIERKMLENSEMEERLDRLKKSGYTKQTPLEGQVGRSFLPESPLESSSDPFSVAISNNPQGVSPLGLNPEHKAFKESKWCYDTPGVVHPDQILNLLTTTEIMETVPKTQLIPRVLHMQPGFSFLIAGIARLDYLNGPDFAWFTVFAAETLPLTVVKTEDADEVYQQLLGTEILNVPQGGDERLSKWPAFVDKIVKVTGKYEHEAAADVVLSSAGWVAVTIKPAEFCRLRAWTPGGAGIHLRQPYMKKPHYLRGPRINKTPVFQPITSLFRSK